MHLYNLFSETNGETQNVSFRDPCDLGVVEDFCRKFAAIAGNVKRR